MHLKKILVGLASFLFCFVCIVSVSAWSIAHFDKPGKQYTMEGDITGNFIHALQGLHKYTEEPMSVDIKSYKPGFLGIGWSQIGTTTLCRFKEGIGIADSGPCYANITNSGTKNIKTTWTQGSAKGYATADIYRQ